MLLLLQIAVVLALVQFMRRAVLRLRQPAVIAEMIAGLMLGPSCFGWIAPRWFAALFPAPSLPPLNALSQLGMVLFMFLVGRRAALHALGARPSALAAIGTASMLAPFLVGLVLGLALHPAFAPAGVARWSFAVFVGAAMSMTAFPVLARILMEHRITDTTIGRIAIATAAFDDVAGWLILAAILSPAKGGTGAVMAARGVGLAAYVLVMIVAVRPLLAGLVARSPSRADRWRMLAPILLVVLTSAAVTDALGVHALFGAFFAGLMMPRADSAAGLEEVIEPLTMTILLPLFFAFTGLRTDVHLLGAAHLLSVTAWILVLAVLSKGGASALAGRLAGLDWRDAFALGALLNTRGLIELVILNIGLDAGILSPVVFSMFVLMTIVTTCMTSPLVVWLYRPSVSSPQYR